jgi:hypothetical protein
MDLLWQDLRFGIRSLRKDHGFLLACVAALGLGIGSTTAIFSVIDNVLLNPFPYRDSERIYGFRIVETNGKGAQDRNYFSVPEFLDYQRQNRIFTGRDREHLLYLRIQSERRRPCALLHQ